jgi:hypothetical protein
LNFKAFLEEGEPLIALFKLIYLVLDFPHNLHDVHIAVDVVVREALIDKDMEQGQLVLLV